MSNLILEMASVKSDLLQQPMVSLDLSSKLSAVYFVVSTCFNFLISNHFVKQATSSF